VLIFAIKREVATGAFYAQMAGLVDPGPEKDLFDLLAKEEGKHKKYVESIYEDVVYKEF
jgi:rubrerythrin